MPTFAWGDNTIVAADAFEPPVVATLSNGGFVMVWTTGTDAASRNLMYQLFDAAGEPVGGNTLVENALSPTYGPTVYATPDGFVVVGTRDFGGTGDDDAMLFQFTNSGAVVTTETIAGSGADELEVTGVYNYNFVNAYITGDEVHVTSHNSDFSSNTNTTIVTSGTDYGLAIGRTPYSNIVAWVNSSSGILAQVVDSNGALTGSTFTVAGFNVFGSYYDIGITQLRSGYAINYSSSSIFGGPSHYVQLYNDSDAAVGSPIYISSDMGALADIEVIRSGSGFLIVYTTGYEQFAVGNLQIMGRFYDAQGNEAGGEFYIATGGGQRDADIAVLGDGRIVVTYHDNGQAAFQIIDPRNGQVNGTAGADTLYGNDLLNDQIVGANGNDKLYGMGGADRLDGGTGSDTMVGGLGDDIYIVDSLTDVVTEVKNQGTDTVRTSVDYSIYGGYVENLVLTGSAAISATGNGSDNVITGNVAANVINGGKGADTMTGGGGSDTYYVDDAGDLVIEVKDGGTADLVNSYVTFSLSGQQIENLTLSGSDAINATGNSLANVITGNSGVNTIDGGSGGDTIRGAGGADVLTGGANVDRFVYQATSESTVAKFDRITDLAGTDIIDLSAIDANSVAGGNQAFSIVSAFSNVAGQMTLSYNAGTALTTILMDTNGDSVADMKIVVNGDVHTYTNFAF